MPKPRLLFLAHMLPFPPDSGVAIRTFNVLRLLAGAFDVTCLCFYRRRALPDEERVRASIDALRAYAGTVEAFPIPQEHSRARLAWDHLRSVATGQAYTRFAYESAAFRVRLEGILEHVRPDLVHVDSLDLAGYLPALRGLPVVCVHHNVESALLRRRATGERSAARRGYLRLQARLTERLERRWAPRVALNVVVSEADREDFQRLAPTGCFRVVSNGVDVDDFTPGAGTESAIAFLGGTEWFPNVDALDHFCAEVLPRLRAAGVEAPVYWIGRATPEEQRRYREQFGVELTGYVDDIRPWVHDAACTVVPLRIGGGTRLKITTAWAMGKAVISTSVGCEGLDGVDGQNILIRDTPQGFADAVRAVLDNPALRAHLGHRARQTAETVYSWEVIGERMIGEYRAAMNVALPPARASIPHTRDGTAMPTR